MNGFGLQCDAIADAPLRAQDLAKRTGAEVTLAAVHWRISLAAG